MKLDLYYPLSPYSVNQNFGDSNACTENNNLPIGQRKTVGKIWEVCPPGFTELYPLLGMKGHTGIDLTAYHGQQLYHCGPVGIVEEVQTEVERGLGLGIISNEKFEIGDLTAQAKVRYWHLKGFNVKLGDIVHPGDLIGWCDNTGISSGDHLHFELKPVQQANGRYTNILQSNGYFGAIDPKPYFNGQYARALRKVTETRYFEADMKYKQLGSDIVRLQKILAELGYFTYPENTGNYLEITRQAVFNFQQDNIQLSPWEYWMLKGKVAGTKTREALNRIITNSKQ